MGNDSSKNLAQDVSGHTDRADRWVHSLKSFMSNHAFARISALVKSYKITTISDEDIRNVIDAALSVIDSAHSITMQGVKEILQRNHNVDTGKINTLVDLLFEAAHMRAYKGQYDAITGSHETISDHAYMNIVNMHTAKTGAGDDYSGSCGCG